MEGLENHQAGVPAIEDGGVGGENAECKMGTTPVLALERGMADRFLPTNFVQGVRGDTLLDQGPPSQRASPSPPSYSRYWRKTGWLLRRVWISTNLVEERGEMSSEECPLRDEDCYLWFAQLLGSQHFVWHLPMEQRGLRYPTAILIIPSKTLRIMKRVDLLSLTSVNGRPVRVRRSQGWGSNGSWCYTVQFGKA